ncbi:hypothetical protein P3T76_003940 [Phytophthora citrophthora]|uniref:Uncharacterized protein n=1 Tax=Phytophthora citrophthora TaxID=4793 RepID=A0AAD9GTV7_9STRA|nr:hypothetical protein P3T76_003940 [Phytophthora citrophthora]
MRSVPRLVRRDAVVAEVPAVPAWADTALAVLCSGCSCKEANGRWRVEVLACYGNDTASRPQGVQSVGQAPA